MEVQCCLHSHQFVLLSAEDQLVVEILVPEVLCYGEAAQTVARVVEIPGPQKQTHHG